MSKAIKTSASKKDGHSGCSCGAMNIKKSAVQIKRAPAKKK